MISFSEITKVIRSKKGVYKAGFYEDGTTSELSMKASIQPHFYKENEFNTHGKEVSDAIKLYTNEPLIVKTEEYISDIIDYRGRKYEVYQVKDYSSYSMLPHYKSIALALNEGEQ